MRRSALVLFILLALVGAIVTSGCSGSRIEPEQSEVVRSYAQGLVSTLSATTLDGIRPYASAREAGRMRLYVVMLLEQRGQRVQARLLSQEIQSTETLSETTARVAATERWSLTYVDKDTGAVESREDYDSQVTYNLVKTDGKWLVDEVITQ